MSSFIRSDAWRATGTFGDAAEVTDRRGAVAWFGGADRLFVGL
jgi:hypothetical protein